MTNSLSHALTPAISQSLSRLAFPVYPKIDLWFNITTCGAGCNLLCVYEGAHACQRTCVREHNIILLCVRYSVQSSIGFSGLYNLDRLKSQL